MRDNLPFFVPGDPRGQALGEYLGAVHLVITQGLLVISDQKCSRVVEKLITLLANFIAFQEGGRRPTFGTEESNEEEKLKSRLRCLDSYVSLIRSVAPLAPDLATHPNGSHVLQTLLNSIPAVIEFERSERKETSERKRCIAPATCVQIFRKWTMERLAIDADTLVLAP